MQRMGLFSAFLVSFLAVPVTQAASGAVLDLTPALEVMEDILQEQDRQDASASFYESPELFPGEEGISELPAEFVTIRVGTTEVVLRDVPMKEWFAPYVRDLADLGLVSGYRDVQGMPTGLFGSADPVTLEQLAKVGVLAAGIDPGTCTVPPQNKTASGSWSAAYVGCAEQRGWAVYSDASADLRKPATREQVVMTVLQAFRREFDIDTASLTFTDVEKTSAFAPAIAKAEVDGVVSGYTDGQGKPTGEFGPAKNVTRAEFSKIVSIALQLYAD